MPRGPVVPLVLLSSRGRMSVWAPLVESGLEADKLVIRCRADALRRSQASVGQAKRRGAGVTVRKLAGMASALGGRLVLSVEWDEPPTH